MKAPVVAAVPPPVDPGFPAPLIAAVWLGVLLLYAWWRHLRRPPARHKA